MTRICVFCGSSNGDDPRYRAMAGQLGTFLAEQQIGIVYGGSAVGLMGAVADAALAVGGEVIGVLPRGLHLREVGHPDLTKLHIVETMHQRKALMADLSDGFVALPGGMGTLEELCEILTWAQLGVHTKPCAILNVVDYYAPLLAFLDQMVQTGFLRATDRSRLLVATDPADLVAQFAAFQSPDTPRWLERDET